MLKKKFTEIEPKKPVKIICNFRISDCEPHEVSTVLEMVNNHLKVFQDNSTIDFKHKITFQAK